MRPSQNGDVLKGVPSFKAIFPWLIIILVALLGEDKSCAGNYNHPSRVVAGWLASCHLRWGSSHIWPKSTSWENVNIVHKPIYLIFTRYQNLLGEDKSCLGRWPSIKGCSWLPSCHLGWGSRPMDGPTTCNNFHPKMQKLKIKVSA